MGVQNLKRLNGKHYIYAKRFAFHHDKTRAAIEAGYNESGAGVIGYQLHQNESIRSLITRYEAEISEKYEITNDRILKEYARLGFSDIRHVVTWDADGVNLTPSDELTDDQAASIREVSFDIEKIDIESSTEAAAKLTRGTFKLKLHDKKSALDALAKLRGMGASEADKELSLSGEDVDRIQEELHDRAGRMIENQNDLSEESLPE